MTQVRRAAWGVCVGVLLAPGLARAQDTIEALVATALERSPEIRAARTALAAAEGDVMQAGLRPNPDLIGSHLQMSGAQHGTFVGIEWPLDLFRRPSRVAVARQAAEATTSSVRDRERMLAARVREQAGRLLAARRSVEVMNEALGAARRLHELLDAKVNEGDIRKLDANIAAVEVARMEADLTLAQADVTASDIALRALAGLPADTPLTLRDSLEALARVPAPETPQADAEATLAMRPDVQAATARVALAESRVTAARQEGRLDMKISGLYGHEFSGFAQRGITERGALAPIRGSFNSVTVGATVTLPVRNRNQGAVASLQAMQSGEEELLAARRLAARSELDAAVVRDREARRAVEMYATGVRELARQNVDVELEAYDLGRTSLAELLTEQRRYLDVEAAYTTVLQRAYEARVALRQARGEVQ